MEYDLSNAEWRKSSTSGANDNCVEVGCSLPGIIAIRDSKNPNGPVLAVTRMRWAAFTAALRTCGPDVR
jgi:hypothetical protein